MTTATTTTTTTATTADQRDMLEDTNNGPGSVQQRGDDASTSDS